MASIPSFIFGAGTKYKTQEELERAREQVKAMLGDIGHSGLTGWGSVLADLGKGIAARVEKGRISEGQEGLEAAQAPFGQTLAEIAGGYGGGGGEGSDTVAGGAGTDPVNQAFTRPPPSSAQDAVFQNSGGSGGDYLRYANQGATRNKPLAPKLEQALSFLGDLGVTAEVFSGGQDASGPHRTGSHRHDHGNAGDIRFYKDGRPLSWANKADLPLFQEIVRRGKAAGITGFGAGPGYMGEGTMHVGFGSPSVWGAGGRSRNAPDWLRGAYNSADASGDIFSEGGATTQMGGSKDDTFLQAKPFDLHNRFRITPAMLGSDEEPVPAPPPAAVPAAPAPIPVRNVPVNDAGLRTPAGADFLSRMGNPAPMGGQPLPMVPTMNGPMPPPAPPPQAQPVPAPPPAPAPVSPTPAPPRPQVDPFTQMILGDKAGQFKPGNYIPPAPTGAQVFPAAPPAPGTPAAAGFGVPRVAGGGGADRLAGQGTFPPAPPAPGQQQRGGPQNVIGKLMTIIGSPYASDEQKRMATAMLNREYALEDERRKAAAERASPEHKLAIRKAELEIKKLESDGKSVIPMTPEMRRAFNIPDDDTRPWMLVDGKPELIGGANAPSSGLAKPDEEAVSSVRKEIRQLPQTEVLAQAAPIYRDMVKAAGRTGKVSDISLVMGLGKILDPKSVVREGEQVVVKNAASLPQWLQGQIDALNGGAELTPDTRQKLLAEAHSRVNSYSDEYKNATEFFRQMATRRGYDPLDLIQDFGTFEPWVQGEGPVVTSPSVKKKEDEFLNPTPGGNG